MGILEIRELISSKLSNFVNNNRALILISKLLFLVRLLDGFQNIYLLTSKKFLIFFITRLNFDHHSLTYIDIFLFSNDFEKETTWKRILDGQKYGKDNRYGNSNITSNPFVYTFSLIIKN